MCTEVLYMCTKVLYMRTSPFFFAANYCITLYIFSDMQKNYIPRNDSRFWEWVQNLYAEATKGFVKWKIAAPELFLETPMADFETKMAKMSDPNRGRIDTLEKNALRKTLEKACREYVQGFLARNPVIK